MMEKFFIGKGVHWLLIGLVVPIGYLAGSYMFHVIHFVTWAASLFGLTILLILALWLTSNKDDVLTRDPLPSEEEIKLREYAD